MRRAVLLLCLGLIGGLPAGAAAQEVLNRVPELVAPEPHGRVKTRTGGFRVNFPVNPAELSAKLSARLSEACTRLNFNQIKQGKYYILVPRENRPPQRFGYANGDGFNLYDPNRLRGADQVYLFRLDGTSECEVYAFANQR